MGSQRLIIGTRGSLLARTQTQWVADALRRAHPDLEIDIRLIQTQGDKTQAANVPLSSFGEKGIFAKELETALLAGEIDLAVHSMKDMAHTLPEGLTIAAVPEREDPRDCLVGATFADLPRGLRVGTGSVRRRALLLYRCPNLHCLEVRGNIDTRLRKLREGECDVLCLAVAGLKRLGLQEQITEMLDPSWFTPDPGQGALCLQTREDDTHTREIVQICDHVPSHCAVRAERAFLRAVGGSCHTPVGALAHYKEADWHDHGSLRLEAMIGAPDGSFNIYGAKRASRLKPEKLGSQVAARLAEQLRAVNVDNTRRTTKKPERNDANL